MKITKRNAVDIEANESLTQVEGVIHKINYDGRHKGQNFVAFTIQQMDSVGKRPVYIKVAGNAHDLIKEQNFIRAYGVMENTKFGQQLKLSNVEALEVDQQDMLKMTEKRAFMLTVSSMDGIGGQTASHIYRELEARDMTMSQGASSAVKNMVRLYDENALFLPPPYSSQSDFHDYMDENLSEMVYCEKLLTLSSYISLRQAKKAYQEYPNIEEVLDDPYRLSHIDGISFSTVDRIASELKHYEANDYRRLLAAANYALQVASKQDGHLYLPLLSLHSEVKKLIGDVATANELYEAIQEDHAFHIVEDEESRLESPIYKMSNFIVEQKVALHINRLLNEPGYRENDLRKMSSLIEKDKRVILDDGDVPLSDEQHKAVFGSLKHKVSVTTGGAGRGKTTTMKKAVAGFLKAGFNHDQILCVAPTGKAAKRMQESTGFPATTIHRALGYDGEGYEKNSNNKLDAKVIFCDETSMKDIFLAYRLLEAMPDDAYLIQLGDVQQIESVGPGKWFKDLIDSKTAPVHYLTIPFRNDAGTLVKAEQVLAGDKEGFWDGINDFDDVTFTEVTDNIAKEISSERNESLSADDIMLRICINKYKGMMKKGYDKYDDIQVLAPMRAGTVGVFNLNRAIRDAVNPNAIEHNKGRPQNHIQSKEYNFFEGDKIMLVNNDHEKGLMNGETGVLISISKENRKAVCRIDGQEIVMDFGDFLSTVEPAWAFTSHKSQGSEYKGVIIPMSKSHVRMWKNSLFYTAMTRNKEDLQLIGEPSVIDAAIDNKFGTSRNSGVVEALQRHVKVPGRDFDQSEDESENMTMNF